MFGQGFNSPQLHQRFEPRLKAIQKQGVRHKCHSLFLWLAPCLALRSVPLMGTEIVTRLYLDISISRHSLSAIAIPSRTLSAPYDSPQLHQARPSRTYLFRTKSFGWFFLCLILNRAVLYFIHWFTMQNLFFLILVFALYVC